MFDPLRRWAKHDAAEVHHGCSGFRYWPDSERVLTHRKFHLTNRSRYHTLKVPRVLDM